MMTITERFDAYYNETNAFIFGEWCNLSIAERDARQAEIDARHGYKHGWITVDGKSYNDQRPVVNVWD